MATKPCRMVIYPEGLRFIKAHEGIFGHMFLRDHATNKNDYIFIFTESMTTKPERMMTYLEGLLPLKLRSPLLLWSRKIM